MSINHNVGFFNVIIRRHFFWLLSVFSIILGAISVFTLPVHAADPLAISSVSPSSGGAAGGDVITISGTGFVSGSAVRVDGVSATDVVVQSDTIITARTPTGSPGTVTVSVTTPTPQTVVRANAFTYTQGSSFSISSITPSSGPETGGTAVTVTGTGFIGYVPITNVSSSSTGDHMCGIAAGTAYCWGLNGSGRLGDSTTTSRTSPTKVVQANGILAGKTVTEISAGSTHSCAIANGEAYCWGNNTNGQLGDGSGITRQSPVKVTQAAGLLQGKVVTSISAGTNQTCAVAGGEAYCWGANANNQLGDGTVTPRTNPVKVTQAAGLLQGKTVTAISTSSVHTCAVASSEAYCWGDNGNGRLGDSSTTLRTTPVKVTQATGLLQGKAVTAVSTGTTFSCAIADGEAYCWGANGAGQLGDTSTSGRTAPVKVTQTAGLLQGKTVTSITTASSHTCAVASGQAFCWGRNNLSKLGDGTLNNSSVPVAVSTTGSLFEKTVTGVTNGTDHSCVLARQSIYCFGDNTNGQFGNGTTTASTVPTQTSIQDGALPLELTIGSVSAPITSQGSTQLNAVTAASTSGLKNVSLRRTDTNQTATLSNGYQYIGTPQLMSIAPTSGSTAGGDRVSLYGQNFVNGASVSFGANAGTNVTYVDDTRIDVTSPAALSSGSVNVTVTNPDTQQAQLSNAYTYIPPPPTVSSVSAAQGKMGGGNTVQISGSQFAANSLSSITFDGVAATNISVTNSTTLSVTVPASTTVKLADIVYTDTYGQSATLANSYRYLPQSYTFATPPLVLSATEPGQMTIQARSPGGLPVTIDDGFTVQLSSSKSTGYFALTLDESGGDPWQISSISFAAGNSNSSFYYKDTAKGTPTITARDDANTSVSQGATINSSIRFQVTGVSDPIAAGVPSSVTVRAVDYRGQPETSYTGTVRFSSDDPSATLPGNFIITSSMKGVRTFVNGVTFGTTGDHCLTVTDINDSIVTGAQCGITTTARPSGTIDRLKFITSEQFVAAGASSSAITIQAQDSSGSPVAVTQDTPIYISSNSTTAQYSNDGIANWSGTSPQVLVIPNGATATTFYYRDNTQRTSQLLAADRSTDTTSVDLGLTNDVQNIVTGTGSPAGLRFNDPGHLKINQMTPLVVRVVDNGGNTATTQEDIPFTISTSNSSVSIYKTANGSPESLPATVIVPAGSSQVTIYALGNTLGDTTLTIANTTGYSGDSLILTTEPALPYRVKATSPPTATVGTSTAVQLQLYDAYGNVSPATQNIDIGLSTNNPAGEFRTSQNGTVVTKRAIPTGQSSVTVYYFSSDVGSYTISASGSNLVGETNPITVEPGSPASLSITTPNSILVAGSSRQYNFEVRDTNGFPTNVTSDMLVNLTSATGGEFSADNSNWTATSVVIPSGSNQGTFYYRNTTSGTDTMSLSAANSTLTANQQQVIVASVPRVLEFVSLPQSISRNTASGPISISFKDTYGNPAVANSSTVITLSDTSGSGLFAVNSTGPWSSTRTVTVANGAMNQVVYYKSSSIGTWQLQASAPNYQATSQSIEVKNSAPTKVILSSPQTSLVAGEPSTLSLTTTSSDDIEAPVSVNTEFSLASTNDGQFSETLNPFTPITKTTLSQGNSNKTLYYRATSAGVATLSATASGYQAASYDVPVSADEVYRFTVNPATQNVEINTDSAPYVVETHDVYGNVSPVSGSTDVYLYSDKNSGSFSGSGVSGNHVSIASGQSTVSFTYKDSSFNNTPALLTVSDKTMLDNPDIDIQNDTATATITSALPTSIDLDTTSQSIVAGEYSNKITVSLKTSDGQPAYQDGTKTVALTTNKTGGFYTNAGDTTTIPSITIPRGENSVDVYYRGTLAGVHTLTSRYNGQSLGTKDISITAAEVKSMNIVSTPQTIARGEVSGQIITKFYDEYMNAASLSSNATIDVSSSCMTGQLSLSSSSWQAVRNINVASGSDQFILYYRDTQPAQCSLTFKHPDFSTASQPITVSGSTASRLTITLDDSSLESGQETIATVRVTDQLGNVSPVEQNTTLYFTTTSDAGVFNATSRTLGAGQSQTTVTYKDATVGNHTVTVRDQVSQTDAGDSLTDASTSVTITPGDPAKIQLQGLSNSSVGTPYALTIQLLNAYDYPTQATQNTSLELSSNQTGIFSTSPSGSPTTTATFPSGQSALTVYYAQSSASSAQLSVSDPSSILTVATKQVNFGASGATSLQFVSGNNAMLTGEYKQQTVRLLDQYGNLTTSDTTFTLYLGASSTTGAFYTGTTESSKIQSLQISPGTSAVNFYYKDTTPGSATLTAGDDITSGDVGLQNATKPVTVSHGQPTGIRINQGSFSVERGMAYGPVQASYINAAGNTIPAPVDGQITLTSSGTGEVSASLISGWQSSVIATIESGQLTSSSVYIRNATGNVGTTYDLTASTTYNSSSFSHTVPYTVTYGTAVQLAITSPQQSISANHPSAPITIELRNTYGARVPANVDQRVYLRSTKASDEFSSSLQGPWGVNFVTIPAGQTQVAVYFRSADTGQHTITAADNLPVSPDQDLINAQQQLTTTPQVIDHFYVANISDPQKAGTPSSVVVIAQDSANYTIPSYNGTISFTSNDFAAVLPSSYTFNPSLDKGSKTFTNAIAFKSPGEKEVIVNDQSGNSGRQQDITVTPPNTQATSSLVFISPDPVETYEIGVSRISEPLTIQLRDGVNEPTTSQGAGTPIRITSSSSSGQLALTPGGVWQNELVTTIAPGLSSINAYYRDSTAGNYTVSASDWFNNSDSTAILNATLNVTVGSYEITDSTLLYSRSALGNDAISQFIFPNNESGLFSSRIVASFNSRSIPGHQPHASNWKVDLSKNDVVTNTVEQSDTARLTYDKVDISGQVGRDTLTLNAQINDSSAGQIDRDIALPISPWKLEVTTMTDTRRNLRLIAKTHTNRPDESLSLLNLKIYRASNLQNPIYQTSIDAEGKTSFDHNLTSEQIGDGNFVSFAQILDKNRSILAEDISPIFTAGRGTLGISASNNPINTLPQTSNDGEQALLNQINTISPNKNTSSESKDGLSRMMNNVIDSYLIPLISLLLIIVGCILIALKKKRTASDG